MLAPLSLGGRTFPWGERTFLMAILNVTNDSFAGDGIGADRDAALRRARQIVAEGGDIIDVGGHSTRPGGPAVCVAEEMERVVPVIQALVQDDLGPISVDTYRALVARAAVEAGATIVNDVQGRAHEPTPDPELPGVAAELGACVVVTHNHRGTDYPAADRIGAIVQELAARIQLYRDAGVPMERIIADPGVGFGKDAETSLEVLRRLDEFASLGSPILVGSSRKSFIGAVLDLPVAQRLEGGLATVALAVARGADIVRVHDVEASLRVARITDAVVRGWHAAPP